MTSLEDLVDVVFDFDAYGTRIKPYQFKEELVGLLEIVAERRPRTVLDIGTATGGTLFLLTRVAADDATIVSVDLRRGQFGGGYSPARIPLYRSFRRAQQSLTLVRGNSHDPALQRKVRRLFGRRAVEFALVDGDHSYEGVLADATGYGPLIAKGGLVAFHDIVPGPAENVGGSPRAWQTLKAWGPSRELVRDWAQGSAGYGLLEFP